jgi:hypothetical protein
MPTINKDGVVCKKGGKRGGIGGDGGDTGLAPADLYYCGRRMGHCRCGECDGRCGPTNGCPCEACLAVIGLRINLDGVLCNKGGSRGGTGGDTGMAPSDLYYCGRRMGHCRCGKCDGRCGPTNGCPCEGCLAVVGLSVNTVGCSWDGGSREHVDMS